VGAKTAKDAEIMEYAREHNYVVITHDLDFGAMLAAHRGAKPSVVQIRAEDASASLIGRQIIEALFRFGAELEDGVLLTIEPARTRVRFLPLKRD
jgi:predicted nuclease of predicted toxin-antitoxin system